MPRRSLIRSAPTPRPRRSHAAGESGPGRKLKGSGRLIDQRMVGTVDFAALTGDELVISPESRELSEAYPLYGSIVDFTGR
jgi:hypothetical protein